MATEQLNFKLGNQQAKIDFSALQYHAVIVTATGVDLTAVGGVCDGFLQNKPDVGEDCTIGVSGKSKCVASVALAKGVDVAVDAAGKVKAAASGHYIIGRLLEAASADGDIVSLLITRPGRTA